MKCEISPRLKRRLHKIAQQQQCSLETLLSDYATQLEQPFSPNHFHHPSEQFYRGLIESQIDFVCRYTPDTRLTYVNSAYCQYFERQAEALIGVSFLSLTPDMAFSSYP